MGAKGDGKTKDTVALQAAIDGCAAKGGGDVRLAAGTYLSAPLALRSHVRLLLEKGAILLGSPDIDDYPVREDAKWRRVSLLHADKVTDIAIVGEGTVDGQGQIWWTRQLNRAKGSPEDPRPMLVDITNSSKILFEGVTLQNSPQYNIITFVCDGLTVRNVRILNPGRGAPNTDGIDPLSTSHVLIEHTYIDTGDDNIAIKSGLVGRDDPLVPSTDIVNPRLHLRERTRPLYRQRDRRRSSQRDCGARELQGDASGCTDQERRAGEATISATSSIATSRWTVSRRRSRSPHVLHGRNER